VAKSRVRSRRVNRQESTKRTGRPAKPLRPAVELVTKRIRHLIDLAHDGNVHEASKVSGVASPTLRALYSGRNTNPELKTLEKLGRAYGFYAGWFTDPGASESPPAGGLVFLVRVPHAPTGWRVIREITIPWASWPLPDVFDKLSDYLLTLPRGPERPIIGELGDEPEQVTEMMAKIAMFLLAPLDESERLAGRELGGPLPFDVDEGMVRRMRLLGMFWRDSLAPLIGGDDT
jgi:hypothetical protein